MVVDQVLRQSGIKQLRAAKQVLYAPGTTRVQVHIQYHVQQHNQHHENALDNNFITPHKHTRP